MDTRKAKAHYENIDEYKRIGGLTEATGGVYSHHVDKITKNNEIFYKKAIDVNENMLRPIIEATAGQLCHLFMPYQPKTFLAKDRYHRVFILSQELPGSQGLDKLVQESESKLKQKLSAKDAGFGSIMMFDYFMNEIDDKLSNMAIATVAGKEKITRFDFDWCFAAIQHPTDYGYAPNKNQTTPRVTASGIQKIPLMSDYRGFNHLDFLMYGAVHKRYLYNNQFRLIENALSNESHFRKEVNDMMLKIYLMPLDLIETIISRNTNNQQKYATILQEYNNRRSQLIFALGADYSFFTYLKSPAAEACMAEMKNDIANFQKNYKLPSIDYSEQIAENFEEMNLVLPRPNPYQMDITFNEFQSAYNSILFNSPYTIQELKETIAAGTILYIYADDVNKPGFKNSIDRLKFILNEAVEQKIDNFTPIEATLQELTVKADFADTPKKKYAALLLLQKNILDAAEIAESLQNTDKKSQYIAQAEETGKKIEQAQLFLPYIKAIDEFESAVYQSDNALMHNDIATAAIYSTIAAETARIVQDMAKGYPSLSADVSRFETIATDLENQARDYIAIANTISNVASTVSSFTPKIK